MKLPIYQVDAFARKTFEGNPAAVVPLNEWIPDEKMQAIAAENNLAETAFFVPAKYAAGNAEKTGFHIRWFTPVKEIKLCGHATLASAWVLFHLLDYKSDSITFDSLSGPLIVSSDGDLLTMDFPSQPPQPCEIPGDLVKGLGKKPVTCLRSEDYIAVFENPEDVAGINPDHSFLKNLDLRGVLVSAPAKDYDFVLRAFAPKYGVDEDPVTGSAFTQLAPYWSEILSKNQFKAKQISKRGGEVFCRLNGDRVLISGTAVKYLDGTIKI